MKKLAGLLRAVNVGGTGKLPMAELRKICGDIGVANAKTLLASGNVIFETELSNEQAHEKLSAKLEEFFGTRIGLFILDAAQMTTIERANPFPDHNGSQIGVLFVDELPTKEECQTAKNLVDEVIEIGTGVIYIKYPNGMGQSKLVAPKAKSGTMRNMNTVAKLSALLNE